MAWSTTTLFLPLLAAGCGGQSVEGAWTGPFPLDGARSCEMRLNGDRSMAIECDKAAIVGGGKYRWDGSRMEIEWAVLTYDGKKTASPAPFVFKVRGEGNLLRAVYAGQVYEWRRTMR